MQTDKECLVHIGQCIRRIVRYTNKGRSDFVSSPMIQDAVLWNIEFLCVAAKQLSEGERASHPEVDWAHMANLFGEIVVNPWLIDQDAVWNCVEKELPGLEHYVREILVAPHMK